MTNQEKQAKKPLANANPEDLKETARISVNKKIVKRLTQEEITVIDGFENMLDKKLGDLKKGYHLTGEDMYNLLDPYLSGPNIVSKICPPSGSNAKERRHVNVLLMAAMHRVFGISIDAILYECFQSLPSRQPPRK